MTHPNSKPLTLDPIGFLRSTQSAKFQLPPQPLAKSSCQGLVEIVPGQNFELALRDLEGFSHIWLIWWFHKNTNWKPTTLPPRGRTGRKGTFATRSPYRPNPLAMSCVELLAVKKGTLFIGPHDLLSDTPILDIKPYIPEFDSFPEAQTGWYQKMQQELAEAVAFELHFSETAHAVLEQRSPPEVREKIGSILSVDPFPHRTRRIVKYDDGYRLSCGDWRIYYTVTGQKVHIDTVEHRSN